MKNIKKRYIIENNVLVWDKYSNNFVEEELVDPYQVLEFKDFEELTINFNKLKNNAVCNMINIEEAHDRYIYYSGIALKVSKKVIYEKFEDDEEDCDYFSEDIYDSFKVCNGDLIIA